MNYTATRIAVDLAAQQRDWTQAEIDLKLACLDSGLPALSQNQLTVGTTALYEKRIEITEAARAAGRYKADPQELAQPVAEALAVALAAPATVPSRNVQAEVIAANEKTRQEHGETMEALYKRLEQQRTAKADDERATLRDHARKFF